MTTGRAEHALAGGPQPARAARAKDADTLALERDLSNLLGLKVEIDFSGKGGRIVFHYASLEQLDDILHRISHGKAARAPDDTPADADGLQALLEAEGVTPPADGEDGAATDWLDSLPEE